MKPVINVSRRQLLKKMTLSAALMPVVGLGIRAAFGADVPLLAEADPTAKALKYVDDAGKAMGAKPGSKCATCALYQGTAGSSEGPCQLFPGKKVRAAGWCMSWTAKTT
jgi:High potential iron-sulfur protein